MKSTHWMVMFTEKHPLLPIIEPSHQYLTCRKNEILTWFQRAKVQFSINFTFEDIVGKFTLLLLYYFQTKDIFDVMGNNETDNISVFIVAFKSVLVTWCTTSIKTLIQLVYIISIFRCPISIFRMLFVELHLLIPQIDVFTI